MSQSKFEKELEQERAMQCACEHEHPETVREVRAAMPDENVTADLSDFFKVFGDCTRIRILCVLLYGEMCVCDIAQALSMTQSAISHQLRVLKQAALVKSRREGKTVYYALSDHHIISILNQGLEHIEE